MYCLSPLPTASRLENAVENRQLPVDRFVKESPQDGVGVKGSSRSKKRSFDLIGASTGIRAVLEAMEMVAAVGHPRWQWDAPSAHTRETVGRFETLWNLHGWRKRSAAIGEEEAHLTHKANLSGSGHTT
jgi:hypothetical protein